MNVIPNPMTGSATISLTGNAKIISTIRIYDMQGKLVRYVPQLNEATYLFEKKNLTSGMYIYKLVTSTGKVGTGKVLVK